MASDVVKQNFLNENTSALPDTSDPTHFSDELAASLCMSSDAITSDSYLVEASEGILKRNPSAEDNKESSSLTASARSVLHARLISGNTANVEDSLDNVENASSMIASKGNPGEQAEQMIALFVEPEQLSDTLSTVKELEFPFNMEQDATVSEDAMGESGLSDETRLRLTRLDNVQQFENDFNVNDINRAIVTVEPEVVPADGEHELEHAQPAGESVDDPNACDAYDWIVENEGGEGGLEQSGLETLDEKSSGDTRYRARTQRIISVDYR